MSEYVFVSLLGAVIGAIAFGYLRFAVGAYVNRALIGLTLCSAVWISSFFLDIWLGGIIMEPVLRGDITGHTEGLIRSHSWIIMPFAGTGVSAFFALTVGRSKADGFTRIGGAEQKK